MEEEENVRLKFYCRELLNGRPAMSVPRTLLPKICSVMEAVKSNAIRDGNAERVRLVQSVLADLRHVQDQNTKQKEQSRSAQLPSIYANDPRNANRVTNELNKTLERLANGGSYDNIDPDILRDLISFTRKKIDTLLKQKSHFRAQRYENVLNKLELMIPNHAKRAAHEDKKKELTEHLEAAKRSLAEEIQTMEAELQAHESETEEARNKLYRECDEALEEFDAATSGELPPSYKKSSQRLLNLRQTESLLTKSGRVEEAAGFKNQADDLEKSESLEMRKKYERDREAKRAKLQEQQKHKMIFFEQNNARVRSNIEASHGSTIRATEQLISRLERKLRATEAATRGTQSNGPSRQRSPRPTSTLLSQGSTPRTTYHSQGPLLSRFRYRALASNWRFTSRAGRRY